MTSMFSSLLPLHLTPPVSCISFLLPLTSDLSGVEQFIRSKYERKLYVSKVSPAPVVSKGNESRSSQPLAGTKEKKTSSSGGGKKTHPPPDKKKEQVHH